jgi:uncharacterized protein (TIGR02246 family)
VTGGEQTPEQTVRELFATLDRMDVGALEASFDDDAQGVDEMSGGWRRGRESLHEYFSQITGAGLTDLRSSATDVHTKQWGDTALVTFVLEQTYTLEGERASLQAPSTIVLRRADGQWRIALVHSVPLADQS